MEYLKLRDNQVNINRMSKDIENQDNLSASGSARKKITNNISIR
jgi:hypothetical protein